MDQLEAATEIARQLKLRNIGGVVIIDFIDMESRRDQLMLLEHFTQAMRDDQARPQIAQITELGLVEPPASVRPKTASFWPRLPQPRRLGHVVTLPGKDTLQPLASLPGLVFCRFSEPRSQPTMAMVEAAAAAAAVDALPPSLWIRWIPIRSSVARRSGWR